MCVHLRPCVELTHAIIKAKPWLSRTTDALQRKTSRWHSRATLRQRLEDAELQQLAADAEKASMQHALDQAKAVLAKMRCDYTGVCRERDDAQYCLRESSHLTAELQTRCRKLEQQSEAAARSVAEQARSLAEAPPDARQRACCAHAGGARRGRGAATRRRGRARGGKAP